MVQVGGGTAFPSLNCLQSISFDASTFFWKRLLAISICSGEVFNTAAQIWCRSMKDSKVVRGVNISPLVWYESVASVELEF